MCTDSTKLFVGKEELQTGGRFWSEPRHISCKGNYETIINLVPPEVEVHDEQCTSTSNRFGCFMFSDIAYRYLHDNGFMFRVGVSPSFKFCDKYRLKESTFYPYVGLG